MEKIFYPTIGLEIHAELNTKTKMFCSCKNDPDEHRQNTNICPICMGHPGTLPVINKEAVKKVIKVGLGVKGKIADFTEFDRKNYFYPDIPKGYQISQYKYPLVSGGTLNGVELTRVHLEEDTATSSHDKGEYSLVDFNRAGVPLMELVTEPVIKNAKQAGDFARELQLLLRYLDVSEANMEKGEMRVEANVSISESPDKFGTKVEVKNLNSFKSVERAIEYELQRHQTLILSGEKIVQETRGFDENTGKTFSQRSKEDSHDYRYFPDPDLPKLYISEVSEWQEENLKKEIPELPEEKRKRYKDVFGIKENDIEVFVQNPKIAGFFEESIKTFEKEKDAVALASNYIVSDLLGLMKNSGSEGVGNVSSGSFGELINLLKSGKISSRGAKDILAILFKDGGRPEEIADKNGWILNNDPESFRPLIQKLLDSNPNIVGEFKAGKQNALNSLIGLAMKESKGSGNPQVFRDLLQKMLS